MYKKITKALILIIFLLERFFYYKGIKADEKDTSNIHHEIIPRFEVDSGKLQAKYENHQLFSIPFTKSLVDGLKSYIIGHSNLNQTVSHYNHLHLSDPTHSYKNKLIDSDIKFNFYFLTAYDLLMGSVLAYYLYYDSYPGNITMLSDTGLKILTFLFRNLKDYRLNSFYYLIYSLIKDVANRDFSSLWVDLKKLIDKEMLLALNGANFSLLGGEMITKLVKTAKDFIFRKGGETKVDIRESMDLAAKRIHQVVEEIEEKTVSPEMKARRDSSDQNKEDFAQMKTLETEEGIQPEPQIYEKVDLDTNQKGLKQTHRELTPSKRRKNKLSL